MAPLTHLVSAPSPEEWGLAYSVEMYSVLLSQDTFLACCLALREGRQEGEGDRRRDC